VRENKHGFKVFSFRVQKAAAVGDEARKKRALALDKNLFSRHSTRRRDRIHRKTNLNSASRNHVANSGGKILAEEKTSTAIFAVRTTAGQEKNVANLIAAKVETLKLPIKAVVVPETLKGYVFVEAEGPHFVEEAIAGIKHVRSRVPGIVSFVEVERYIVVKSVIDELGMDDVVEIVSGPFKGMRAKITRIDKTKGEVTLELLEATFTLPITVNADYVKLIEKAK
jgi:transcriptional antiterminator NusG